MAFGVNLLRSCGSSLQREPRNGHLAIVNSKWLCTLLGERKTSIQPCRLTPSARGSCKEFLQQPAIIVWADLGLPPHNLHVAVGTEAFLKQRVTAPCFRWGGGAVTLSADGKEFNVSSTREWRIRNNGQILPPFSVSTNAANP